jgi:hypothetical protein
MKLFRVNRRRFLRAGSVISSVISGPRQLSVADSGSTDFVGNGFNR